ncbi:sigma-70 family RNA polymerase sigma factor [Candidatus Poribacteria bacterium]
MRSDDETLVSRCLEGDQPAFAFLVNKYKEVVHAYAYRKVGDYQQAEDITQEVFIKAYRKLAQLRWPHRFQSWIYAITSNECKLWLRRHSKEQEREVPWEDVPVENLDKLAVRAHGDENIKLTIESAMETLSDDRQLALSLFYMSNLSVKEIAHFMGVSPNSVKIKLHRARKQLGERLEEMIGKHLSKEKLKAGFVFKVVDAIRDMPIPSLPKPRPTKWMPIPISIGLALLIGIIGFGVSSGKDVSSDMPILKPATFEVSLLPDSDRQAVLDTGSEKINDLVVADAGTTTQTQPAMGTKSSGMVVRRVWENADNAGRVSPNGRYISYTNWPKGNLAIHDFETGENRDVTDEGHRGESSEWSNHMVSR